MIIFQSTLPMRGVTEMRMRKKQTHMQISIHTPHAGSDEKHLVIVPCKSEFQSTLPMRGRA